MSGMHLLALEQVERALTYINRHYPNIPWVIAFSGGKDSTLLLHLIIDFLSKHKESCTCDCIYILYNDTLGEIPFLRELALITGTKAREYIEDMGYDASFIRTEPTIVDTFYWRMIIRGYPVPNYKFRWCVMLLKILPTRKALRIIIKEYDEKKPIVLLVGTREDESKWRSGALKKRGRSVATADPMNVIESHLLETDLRNVIKIAPLRFLREEHVWRLLERLTPPWADASIIREFNGYAILRALYFSSDELAERYRTHARFGCWYCTVSKKHFGLLAAIDAAKQIKTSLIDIGSPEHLKALLSARELLMCISNTPKLRQVKRRGYSRLGPLNDVGKALVLNVFRVIDNITNRRLLYGLALKTPVHGISLRDLLFKVNAEKAYDIIVSLDGSERARNVKIELLRDDVWALKELKKLDRDAFNRINRMLMRLQSFV